MHVVNVLHQYDSIVHAYQDEIREYLCRKENDWISYAVNEIFQDIINYYNKGERLVIDRMV